MSRILANPFGRFFPELGLKVLPHLVDVYQNQPTRGDAGDITPKPVLAYRNIPCWVQSASVEEMAENQRNGLVFTHKVLMFQNPGIANGDFLSWTDMVSNVVCTLNVISINNQEGLGFSWTLTAKEIR